MQYVELDINAAENVRLLSDVQLGGRLYPKGYALNKEDIIIFKMHHIRRIAGVIAEENDISAQTAAGIIAAKLCGAGTSYLTDSKGNCSIAAAEDGIFISNEERLAKFNRLHPEVFLNTIAPYRKVSKTEILARLEIAAPLMSQQDVDEIIFKLSGNNELLNVRSFENRKAALLYVRLQDDRDENRHFTSVVKKLVTDFSGFGFDFQSEYSADYGIDAIADGLEDALKADNDVIFVLAPLPISSRYDMISHAVNAVADETVCSHFPQVGVSGLTIAEKRGCRIIVLPYAYDTADTVLLNRYIKQAVLSEKILPDEFSRLHVPDMPAETFIADENIQALISAKGQSGAGKKAAIAAVVLAAGIGSRSGRNKLMVEMEDGQPLFMKAVNAAIASKAGPVFVVTGYHDEEMQEYLENVDVNVVYNPAYRSGVKTSIALGLKSVPGFCEGTVIIPADMPNLTAADIDKLLSAFKPGVEKQVCVFANKGVKSNPVIWSKALYERADIVPENANLRPVFVEHADYTTVVEVKNAQKLLDVNFPSDIDKVAPPRVGAPN